MRTLLCVAGLMALEPYIAPTMSQVTLTESTASAGLTATHDPVASAIPSQSEWMTGGLAVGDFNNDGYQDIYWISGGARADKLFINNGNGTFSDQAARWGLTDLHCGAGASVADFNGDGLLDIYVTSFGPPDAPDGIPGRNRLYRNNGHTFSEVALPAGVNWSSPDQSDGWGSAWGDYNLDGHLDLFVASWIGPGLGNRLYRNNGDGTFTDVTADSGIAATIFDVHAFQASFIDMNGDLFPELLIAADFGTSRYYINNGDGTFTDFTTESGCGLDGNGMGQLVADIDNDGLFDWYVTSIHLEQSWGSVPGTGNMLYIGQGDHLYIEDSIGSGTNDGGWGWGTVAVDLDQDGWQEIVEVNGISVVDGPWLNERGKLFYNNGNKTFNEIAAVAGFDTMEQGRSLVYLDVENDGDLDLVVSNFAGPLQFYRNDTTPVGHWLRITLDTSTNALLAPNGFGTKVVATANGQSYFRYLNGSPSYLGTSELTIHFGLGSATQVDELRVEWARGQVTVLTDVEVDRHMVIMAPRLGDLDLDGVVGRDDLLILLGMWGPVNGPSDLTADLNADAAIGIVDFLLLLSNWG